MRALSNAFVLGAALALFDFSFATDASAFVRGRACARAVKEYCGHVEPRLGPLRACFETHIDNLSGPCASRMAQVTNAARECEADVKRLCGGVKRAKEIEECMTPRLGEVSKACKAALAKVAVPFAF